jgi:hypothetical protein
MKTGSKRFFFEKKNQKTFIINRSFEEPKPQLVMARLDRAIHALHLLSLPDCPAP